MNRDDGPSRAAVAAYVTLMWIALYFTAWLLGYADGFHRPTPARTERAQEEPRRRAALDDEPERDKAYTAAEQHEMDALGARYSDGKL